MIQDKAIKLRTDFVKWQCRLRQYSVRLYSGQPMAAMCPQVWSSQGGTIARSIITLMLQQDPRDSTAFFKFQVQKSNESEQVRSVALRYLAAEYFQIAEMLSDRLAAIFSAQSHIADQCLQSRRVWLHFAQHAQSFHVPCTARRLKDMDAARDAAIWQARAFNPHVPSDAQVISFAPNWKRAVAQQTC
jgi:hypothetical protein